MVFIIDKEFIFLLSIILAQKKKIIKREERQSMPRKLRIICLSATINMVCTEKLIAIFVFLGKGFPFYGVTLTHADSAHF